MGTVIRSTSVALFFILLFYSSASAQDPFSQAFPGMGAFLFPNLSITTGKTPAIGSQWEGMGGANLALDTGAISVVRNPAALGKIEQTLLYSEQTQAQATANTTINPNDPNTLLNQSFPSFAIATKIDEWTIGFSSTFLSNASSSNYQTIGDFSPTFAGQTQHYTDVSTGISSQLKDLTVGLGKNMGETFSWGISGHMVTGSFSQSSNAYDWSYGAGSYISENGESTHEVPVTSVGDTWFREFTDTYSAKITGYGIDAGLIWKWKPSTAIGLVFRNLYAIQLIDWTWSQSWGKGVTEKHYSPAENDISESGKTQQTQVLSNIALGIASQFDNHLTVALDAEYNRTNNKLTEVRAGLAYPLLSLVLLSGGVRSIDGNLAYQGGLSAKISDILTTSFMMGSKVQSTVFGGSVLETIAKLGVELAIF